MNLADSVAIVTGGTSGIGVALARALAQAGSRVAICGRSGDRVEAAVDRLRSEGHHISGRACDVRDRGAVAAFVTWTQDELGPVDVLVNNAGLGYIRPILDLRDHEIDEMLDVNVRGMFTFTRAVLPGMVARGTGHVVNIASLAGKNGFAGGTAYSASKHAVLGFGRSLMLEVREKGIRVLSVCPGSVATDFFTRAGAEPPDFDRILQPEDVAQTVLASLSLPDRGTVSEIDIRPTNP